MVPAGYVLKRVTPPPDWLLPAPVTDVCSVTACVNDDVVDVQRAWKHNRFGLANDPATLLEMAAEAGADLSAATLFYCEAYEEEIGSDGWEFDPGAWEPLTSVPSAYVETAVAAPGPGLVLLGYDVVVSEDFLQHSPLSCNSIAQTLKVNAHCLFDSLEEAKAAIDSGGFGGGCEPGVYRIYSVYTAPMG